MLLRLKIAELSHKNKQWSMRQLADHLTVEHQTVMYWNQGRCYPRLPMLLKICQLLNCSLDDIVDPWHPM